MHNKKYIIPICIIILIVSGILYCEREQPDLIIPSQILVEYGINPYVVARNQIDADIFIDLEEEKGVVPVGTYNGKAVHRKAVCDFLVIVKDTTPPRFIKRSKSLSFPSGKGNKENVLKHFQASDLSGQVDYDLTDIDFSVPGDKLAVVTAMDAAGNTSTATVHIHIL